MIGERRLFVEKARNMAECCVRNGFEGIEIFSSMKVSQLCDYYDGIGPEWDTTVLVNIIEHIDYIFEPAAFLLDVQYHAVKDRSRDSFMKCNRQFLNNCIRTIKKRYGWWRPKRYELKKSARVLYNACNEHGFESWANYGGKK